MRGIRLFIGFLVVFTAAAGANAQEKGWSDEAELSFIDTEGNTDVLSLSAKNLLKYKFTQKLQGAWKLGALYAESDGEKTAESYYAELRFDYSFTERFYSYGAGGWLKDEFAGIDARYYLGPGIGYQFLLGPKHFLLGEAGLNYVFEDYTDDEEDDFLEARAFAKYEYALTDKNRFSQSVELLYNLRASEDYKVNSETALISALSDKLSLKTSYVIKYDNEPEPASLERTDRILSIAVLANF